ncbi:MAG TPA: hypothetical protein VNI56_01780 [Xanthomonadaceae bacterium]|nr:hypothetical protein [Xanthomonadaceae bacterium]
MKILGASIHGVLDYVSVALFAAVPSLFGLTGLPAMILYALAAVHLLVSLATRYPLGLLKRIPFNAHGMLELAVAVGLVAAPWLLDFAAQETARSVYIGLGLVLFAIWLLSDYRDTPTAAAPTITSPP